MRVIIVSIIVGALIFGINFFEKEMPKTPPPEGIDGIEVTICGYVTKDFECIEEFPSLPQGRAWIRLLSDKPILKEKLTATLYVILDGKRNIIASQAFAVSDPYRFKAFVELNRMGKFVVTLTDPDLGLLGESYVEIYPEEPMKLPE